MHHAARLTAVLVIGAALLGPVARPRAQAPQTPHAFLSVLDSNGVPITSLTDSQVTMQVDGAACTPVRLEPIDWPMKVTVLLDNSGVMAESFYLLRESLRRFLFEVPEGVETSLLTLAPQPRWIVRPTAERRDFWRGIDLTIPDRGSSKFLEGLAEAVDRIDKGAANQFSTIVVITGNGQESSGGDLQKTFNRLQTQLARHPVTVHVVMLAISEQKATIASVGEAIAPGTPTTSLQFGTVGPNTINPGQPLPSVTSVNATNVTLKTSGALQTQVGLALTKDTGGRYEALAVTSSLPSLLPEFGRRIARSYALQRTQYRISCEQPMPTARQISVYTTHPSARDVLLSRDGRIP